MALLDIVMLVMVIGGGFMGWRKRFTGQLGSIFGVILGMLMCRLCASDIAAYFNKPDDTVQTQLFNTVMAYLLVGAGSYLAVRVAVGLMRSVLRAMHLGVIDNIAGAAFNVFQWLLGLSVVLNVWLAVFPDSELRTANQGATDTVIKIAPAVFGSQTAKAVLNAEFSKGADNSDAPADADADTAESDV
jgi:uncharacterized membrane protein required for colicin V production